MYNPNQREQLWKDYYKALHRGDRVSAQRILAQLHTPPSGPPRTAASQFGGGCSRCRRRI